MMFILNFYGDSIVNSNKKLQNLCYYHACMSVLASPAVPFSHHFSRLLRKVLDFSFFDKIQLAT